jgi:hypothetical protein
MLEFPAGLSRKTRFLRYFFRLGLTGHASIMQRQSLRLWLDKETANGNIAQRG